jgi:hypothetical protein
MVAAQNKKQQEQVGEEAGGEVSQERAQVPQKAGQQRYEARVVRDKRGKRGGQDKGATRPRARSEQPLQRRAGGDGGGGMEGERECV